MNAEEKVQVTMRAVLGINEIAGTGRYPNETYGHLERQLEADLRKIHNRKPKEKS